MARVDPVGMNVEVVYAEPDRQIVIQLELEKGATVADAIAQSGITGQVPDASWRRLGIFSRKVTPGTLLSDGDRVEIYRTLLVDPKDGRRNRVVRK